MKGIRVTLALVVVFGLTVGASGMAMANDYGNDGNDHNGNDKVTLCHKTGSDKNPYVKITVSKNAKEAHLAHGDKYPRHGKCKFGPYHSK